MSTVFEGKVRRLGNSLAVTIPKEILQETGAKEGDVMKLAVPVPKQRRKEIFARLAGIDAGSKPFKRDRFEVAARYKRNRRYIQKSGWISAL